MKRRSVPLVNRLLLLNGLAISGVVAHHATSWSVIAMFWWTDRYRPVSVPNYDLLNGSFHYFLFVVQKLTVFAVPSFLFVSGLFVAYMTRGKSSLGWKAIRSRVIKLLIPYFLWSLFRIFIEYLEGPRLTLLDYASELIIGGRYWFIPLLCQLYILSPLLFWAAERHRKWLLVVSSLTELGFIAVYYTKLLGLYLGFENSIIDALVALPYSFLLKLQFFFVLGVVCGRDPARLRTGIHRFRWHLIGTTAVLASLSFLESEVVYRLTDADWWRTSVTSLPSVLYAISFILSFLALAEVSIPLSSQLNEFGKVSLGIYLAHTIVLEVVARATQKLLPRLLAYQLPFYALLVSVSIGVPLLLSHALAKSPMRRLHPYVFG